MYFRHSKDLACSIIFCALALFSHNFHLYRIVLPAFVVAKWFAIQSIASYLNRYFLFSLPTVILPREFDIIIILSWDFSFSVLLLLCTLCFPAIKKIINYTKRAQT